ncbi:Hypothetical predicted protein [Lecanosticta acicola]|uniref:Uncharacterized protein n=1 Tax=Lecanosticta acicola TaxID=111012 RepID=A0AAI8Z4K9_9PEZI|nr:Hypothetical predicted protein [Lecanosticta acicola]
MAANDRLSGLLMTLAGGATILTLLYSQPTNDLPSPLSPHRLESERDTVTTNNTSQSVPPASMPSAADTCPNDQSLAWNQCKSPTTPEATITSTVPTIESAYVPSSAAVPLSIILALLCDHAFSIVDFALSFLPYLSTGRFRQASKLACRKVKPALAFLRVLLLQALELQGFSLKGYNLVFALVLYSALQIVLLRVYAAFLLRTNRWVWEKEDYLKAIRLRDATIAELREQMEVDHRSAIAALESESDSFFEARKEIEEQDSVRQMEFDQKKADLDACSLSETRYWRYVLRNQENADKDNRRRMQDQFNEENKVNEQEIERLQDMCSSIPDLQSQTDSLTKTFANLESEKAALQTKIQNLQSREDTNADNYAELYSQHEDLESECEARLAKAFSGLKNSLVQTGSEEPKGMVPTPRYFEIHGELPEHCRLLTHQDISDERKKIFAIIKGSLKANPEAQIKKVSAIKKYYIEYGELPAGVQLQQAVPDKADSPIRAPQDASTGPSRLEPRASPHPIDGQPDMSRVGPGRLGFSANFGRGIPDPPAPNWSTIRSQSTGNRPPVVLARNVASDGTQLSSKAGSGMDAPALLGGQPDVALNGSLTKNEVKPTEPELEPTDTQSSMPVVAEGGGLNFGADLAQATPTQPDPADVLTKAFRSLALGSNSTSAKKAATGLFEPGSGSFSQLGSGMEMPLHATTC